jgi:hypothetical protein
MDAKLITAIDPDPRGDRGAMSPSSRIVTAMS